MSDEHTAFLRRVQDKLVYDREEAVRVHALALAVEFYGEKKNFTADPRTIVLAAEGFESFLRGETLAKTEDEVDGQ